MQPDQVANTLRASLTADIAAAKRKLAVSILVGQGFTCALKRDATMALSNNAEKTFLTVVGGELRGVLHYTREGAEAVCARWNAGIPEALARQGLERTPEEMQGIEVEPVHYRTLLERLIARAEAMLADLPPKALDMAF